MRYQTVCLEAAAYLLPDEIVTSDEIEERLRPVYERLHLPLGRLEMMTGIRERRFFPPGTKPGTVSAQTAERALQLSGFDRRYVGALIHGSVCRDQLEPATAAGVHHRLGLRADAAVFDVSNACLGLLNGMRIVADMIETGQIAAGLVVGTEDGRELVEGTIDSLLRDESLTRKDMKAAFASLTIGAGSAAVLLCDRRLSRTGFRLIGGTTLADTAFHALCEGGVAAEAHGDDRPRMATDSEAMLHAGIDLAERTWQRFLQRINRPADAVHKVFTHQVGRAHRKMLLERLGLRPEQDFPTVEFLGNTGAAALPMTLGLGLEAGHVAPGETFALLGIGSGLNSIMLAVETPPAAAD